MAKFRFIKWLVEFLFSQLDFKFDWDDGNSSKSLVKHGVSKEAVESIFFDLDLLILGEQFQPKTDEARYGIIGKSYDGEILFVCFTIRAGKIRPISSRLSNQKERRIYEKEIC